MYIYSPVFCIQCIVSLTNSHHFIQWKYLCIWIYLRIQWVLDITSVWGSFAYNIHWLALHCFLKKNFAYNIRFEPLFAHTTSVDWKTLIFQKAFLAYNIGCYMQEPTVCRAWIIHTFSISIIQRLELFNIIQYYSILFNIIHELFNIAVNNWIWSWIIWFQSKISKVKLKIT